MHALNASLWKAKTSGDLPLGVRNVLHSLSARARGIALMPYLSILNRVARRSAVGEAEVVVSLTTYGVRARHVHRTLESIARGHLRPRRLILWVDDPRLAHSPPKALRRLRNRGLEILATKNYYSHKKYYPYVQMQTEHVTPLVTADDDVVYPRQWLAQLMAAHVSDPECVWCFRAREMRFTSQFRLEPYAHWPLRQGTTASQLVVPTGTSGVLYPARMLSRLRNQEDAFMRLAPRADDLWLHRAALRLGIPARQVGVRAVHFPLLPTGQVSALNVGNQRGGQNDEVISRLYEPADLVELAHHCRGLAT